MCIEVEIVDMPEPGTGGLDRRHRRLVLDARLSPLERTTLARALLLQAGVDQPVPPQAMLRCLCGGPLLLEGAPLCA